MAVFARARSEFQYLVGGLRALLRASAVARAPDRTWPVVAEELARRFADRPALIGDDETLTYAGLDARANAYARFVRAHGVGRGDCVALMMANRPDYLAAWLGIARAGGVAALLNTSQIGAALAHSVALVGPKLALVDAALVPAWRAAEPMMPAPPRLFARGACDDPAARLDTLVAAADGRPLEAAERTALTHEDRCLYIFTSGTTGLPKAANINHYRVLAIMVAFAAATAATARDRIYVCLPLYHSSGGLVAVGSALTVGGAAVIAPRFSASRFWDDVVDRRCTMVQYIGELCRYLVNAPSHPLERRHRLRLATGNGLRPDVWAAFQARFAIPRILEWYASTEGNLVLFNFDGTPGVVGRVPAWARFRFPLAVARLDPESGEPVRRPDGRLDLARDGEPGELLSEILVDPLKPSQRFEGYADPAETAARTLVDVRRPGDHWFRTGDLMSRDRRGYYRFHDRLGDGYRWKGENVASAEVAALLGGIAGVRAAAVYGVPVPGHEGRAGMAALVVGDDFSLARFAEDLDALLPAYARPVFLRLAAELPATGTFKLTKLALAREGFDPATIADPLYVRLDGASFAPLDDARHARLLVGDARL